MSTNTKQSRKRLTISNEIKKNNEELEMSSQEANTKNPVQRNRMNFIQSKLEINPKLKDKLM